MLSAVWDDPDNRRGRFGLPYLYALLEREAQERGWQIWSLGDEPQAAWAQLRAALNKKPFPVVVVGAHGSDDRAGVVLADGPGTPWCGDGVDLSSVDLLILASCAVGRLDQSGNRDVEGMCARLAAHRGRSVISARWPIADMETAIFVKAVVANYLHCLPERGQPARFARARALNDARKALVNGAAVPDGVSMHLAAAFDIYGVG